MVKKIELIEKSAFWNPQISKGRSVRYSKIALSICGIFLRVLINHSKWFIISDLDNNWKSMDPTYRRQHIARQMVDFMLTQMDVGKDITVTTYRESDANGIAARAFYKHLGFSEGKLTEEFGCPVQEFVLKR